MSRFLRVLLSALSIILTASGVAFGAADLVLGAQLNPQIAEEGRTTTLTLSLGNTGSDVATNVIVEIWMPSFLTLRTSTGCSLSAGVEHLEWNVGSHVPFSLAICTVSFRVTEGSEGSAGNLDFQASSPTADSDYSDNSAQVSVTVVERSPFVVDTVTDAADVDPGDGMCAVSGGGCSLRAAVMESNLSPGEDLIDLPDLGAPYELTVGSGSSPDSRDNLDVTDSVAIVGSGPDRVPIRGYQPGVDRGGVFRFSTGAHRIENLLLYDGVASDSGGAVHTGGTASLTIANCELLDNYAEYDGGAVIARGDLTVEDSVFRANYAGRYGSAVSFFGDDGSHLSIEGAGFEANESDGSFGGYVLQVASNGASSSTSATIRDSTFSGHQNLGIAAVIWATEPTSIANVTFTQNQGASAVIDAAARLDLQNVTAVGNAFTNGFLRIYDHTPAVVDIRDSLIQQNTQSQSSLPALCGAELRDVIRSVIHPEPNGTSCSVTGVTTGTVYETASLGSFGPHGGKVSTIALPSGSSAVDHGALGACTWDHDADELTARVPLGVDARGLSRTVDGDDDGDARCDAGAFEYQLLMIFSDGFESGNTTAWN